MNSSSPNLATLQAMSVTLTRELGAQPQRALNGLCDRPRWAKSRIVAEMTDIESIYNQVKGTGPAEEAFLDELFSLQGQGEETDILLSKFYTKRIQSYSPKENIGYIYSAVQYALLSTDAIGAECYLRLIVDQPERYKVLGTLLGAAATMLGGLTQYPDVSLANALAYPISTKDEWEADTLQRFANRAFGAYVATATDFEYGLKVANDMDNTKEKPSIERAEQLIAQWKHSK